MGVKLQLLLRKTSRKLEDVKKVENIIESIGMKVTSSGAASISIEAEPQQVARIFGQRIELDSGDRIQKPIALPVPEALRPYVDSITVAPDHLYF